MNTYVYVYIYTYVWTKTHTYIHTYEWHVYILFIISTILSIGPGPYMAILKHDKVDNSIREARVHSLDHFKLVAINIHVEQRNLFNTIGSHVSPGLNSVSYGTRHTHIMAHLCACVCIHLCAHFHYLLLSSFYVLNWTAKKWSNGTVAEHACSICISIYFYIHACVYTYACRESVGIQNLHLLISKSCTVRDPYIGMSVCVCTCMHTRRDCICIYMYTYMYICIERDLSYSILSLTNSSRNHPDYNPQIHQQSLDLWSKK